MPVVTAIIPAHNRTDMLREAAQSVLTQTFSDIELIIVASAATAETIQTANQIAASDPRCRVLVIAKDSLAAARNAGINEADGEWVAFLDDDDIWLPNKIERQLSVDADMVNCDFIERGGELDGITRHIRPPEGLSIAEGFILANYGAASASGAMVRTVAIRAMGGFDEKLRGCEDWDMWRRLSWLHRIIFLDDVLVIVHRHDGAMQAKGRPWFHIAHTVKTILDTPPYLRHMVRRLIWIRLYSVFYHTMNRLTFGFYGSWYRILKPILRPSKS